MLVYLDNNATTRPSEKAIEVMNSYCKEIYGNPSSNHSMGIMAKEKMKALRKEIASSINASENEIIFVGSGSEANNLCIKGYCQSVKSDKKLHIITTNIEHPSVLATFEELEKQGFLVSYLPVDQDGIVSPDILKEAIREETILISIAHSNNEIGTIQRIKELKSIASNIVFHTDAVQSFTKLPFDVQDNKVDLASFSGHKIHAPKGIGFIYKREGIEINPIITGGMQEFGYRAGTENIALIAAMATAISEVTEVDTMRIKILQQKLVNELLKLEGVKLNGPNNLEQRNSTNISVSFAGHEAEAIVNYLNDKGIYVSTRSACSSNSQQVSHVLKAINLEPEFMHSTIRVSISKYTTEYEVETFLNHLKSFLSTNKPYLINKILINF